MKRVTYLLVALFTMLSICSSTSMQAQNEMTNASHVIVKIEGLTLEMYNTIAVAYMKNPDVDIPYYCLDAGVIAMHYKHSGLSDADVQLSVKTELKRIIKNTNIRILDVETRDTEDDSRC